MGRSSKAAWIVPIVLMATQCEVYADVMPVKVSAARHAHPYVELALTGTLVGARHARLSSSVDGLVAQVKVDEGAQVNVGQALLAMDATLDSLSLRQREAELAAARVALAEAERLAAEARRLIAEQHLPRTELDARLARVATATARVAVAEAACALQQERVNQHQLTAPFAGVIYRKLAERGEWITRGTPVLELVASERIYLEAQLPQERFSDVREGTRVTVWPDSQPKRSVTGSVVARVPVMDEESRTFLVKVDLPDNKGGRLMPNTSARAIFHLTPADSKALLVPRDALLQSADGSHAVYTVAQTNEGYKALHRRVEIGQRRGDGVEILAGLLPDETVVVQGNEVLQHDQPVRLVP